MLSLRTAFAATTIVMAIAFPSAAAGATVVPPGNSAATQYTEAFPTAGGNAVSSGTTAGGHDPSPEKVLGHQASKALQDKGQVGREVADVAAETAPVTTDETTAASAGTGRRSAAPAHHARVKARSHAASKHGASGGGGANGVGGGSAQSRSRQVDDLAGAGNGSSAIGQVVGQATGSSSGQLGLLLPLIMLASLAWAVVLAWRHRSGTAQ
jgi:hypothetical protein